MNKEIILVNILRNVINNTPLSDAEKRYLEAGEKEARANNLTFAGQIVIPSQRAISAAGNEGTDVAPTLLPLRPQTTLLQAGARYLSDLVSDVKVPIMSKNTVYWESETGTAPDAGGTFNNVKLSPKRLTAYLDISKQFLLGGGDSVEESLIHDLESAIYDKLEATVLGSTTGANQPSGIFTYTTIPETTINSYSDIGILNANVDNSNAGWKRVYISSNTMKNYLRTLQKGDGQGFVLQDSKIDGERVYSTSNCLANSMVYGDFSNLVIGQWAGTSILVDNFTKATQGIVRLVVNCYVDSIVARPEAFSIGKINITANNIE
jgi:HK97 family phage major capsid protein